jgi:hypothetical protein
MQYDYRKGEKVTLVPTFAEGTLAAVKAVLVP